MEHDKNKNQFKALMIPVIVVNGIVSGIVSVITAYFFKPIWNKVIGYWSKKK